MIILDLNVFQGNMGQVYLVATKRQRQNQSETKKKQTYFECSEELSELHWLIKF